MRKQGRGLWKACQAEGSAATPGAEGPERDPTPPGAVAVEVEVEVYVTSVLPNPFGGRVPEDEPWKGQVKICNAGSEPVNPSGWSLGDKQSSWMIPSGFTVPAQGCVTITGSKKGVFLSNGGDEVILRDPDGKLADRCSFDEVEQGEEVPCSP